MATDNRAGVIAFHVSFKVDIEQLSTWTPERIKAFMDGIAIVIAAGTTGIGDVRVMNLGVRELEADDA